jgi:hypothetical protein
MPRIELLVADATVAAKVRGLRERDTLLLFQRKREESARRGEHRCDRIGRNPMVHDGEETHVASRPADDVGHGAECGRVAGTERADIDHRDAIGRGRIDHFRILPARGDRAQSTNW